MKQGETLFGIWGGIRQMARDLGKPASTIHRWKTEGRVPSNEQPHVLDVAEQLGLPITAEHVVYPLGRPDAVTETFAALVGIVACNRSSQLQRKNVA